MKRKNLAVLLVFIVLAGVMTWPVAGKMWNSIPKDIGDPLYICWAIAWDIHKFETGMTGFWDANIFHPHKLTLAYTDHFIPLAAMVLPAHLLTNNIVFCYNLLFLASFILSSFGAYLLVRYLTGNIFSGVIAGIIFAFAPFKFSQLGHLQILSSQWIPFAFLYMHKFFDKGTAKNLMLFVLFYALQCASCAYYAVILTVSIAFSVIFYTLVLKKYREPGFWKGMTLFCALSFLLIIPFFLPYIRLKKEMGFGWNIPTTIFYSAKIESYFCAPEINRIWGKVTSPFRTWEGELFTGLTPLFLLALGIARRNNKDRKDKILKIHYLALLITAFLITLGPRVFLLGRDILPGPYMLFYKLIPGFSGMRVPSRFAVILLLALGVLAGMGFKNLSVKMKGNNMKKTFALLCFLLLAEYFSAPVPALRVPINEEIPEVYKQLAREPGECPVMELPMSSDEVNVGMEFIYVYYSLYHFKKLVNGQSSYVPPGYGALRNTMKNFPSSDAMEALREMKVKYVILHKWGYSPEAWARIASSLAGFRGFNLRNVYGDDFLYEVSPS